LSRAARVACAVGLAAVLGLAGCMGGNNQEGSARDGGSIGIGASALPRTLDPALAAEPSELQLLWLVHTPLLTYRRAGGRDGTELVPGLAEDMPKVSGDGMTYRLSLRPGLTYSNGAPVRPGDFERAIDRLRALHSPLAPLYDEVVSIEADARTRLIEVTLARPDPAFPYTLALPAAAPVPRGTPQKDLSGRPPAGMGPYRLVRSKYKDRYREDATASTVALVPDTDAAPFDDAAVRRAVGESLDAETLTRLYQGLLEPTCNLLPEVIRGYRKLDPCPYGDRKDPPDLPKAQDRIDNAAAAGAAVSVAADAGVPPAVERYVVGTLRKVGLAASTRRGGALLRVQRFAPPVADPEAFLEPITTSVLDTDLTDAVGDATLAETPEQADDAWPAADRLVVEQGYAAPLGSELRPAFLSERLDIENCFRFQPLFGLDLSSLCIK
jgi:ABC-type transport system substrate-binding protein